MPTLINILTKKDYLRRICGVKHEKFEKITKQLKPVWRAIQKRKLVEGRPYGVGGLREHLLLLLIYYRTYTTHLFLAQIFHVDEATICRAIKRVGPLAERILKIRAAGRTAEKSTWLLLWQKARPYDKNGNRNGFERTNFTRIPALRRTCSRLWDSQNRRAITSDSDFGRFGLSRPSKRAFGRSDFAEKEA